MRRTLSARLGCLTVTGALVIALPAPAHAAVLATDLVSVTADGTQGNENSILPSVDADGRFVVFESPASNLTSSDDNGKYDVFLTDRDTGSLELISRGADGRPLPGDSGGSQISADGRFVTYHSWTGTSAEPPKVYVYDRVEQATEQISAGARGGTSPTISGDGRYVTFTSSSEDIVPDANRWYEDVFLHDRKAGETRIVSSSADGTQGDRSSSKGVVTADGRHVAFVSSATNLVPGDTNGAEDIFLKNLTTGDVQRITVTSDGSQLTDFFIYSDPSVSADGRYVSYATTGAFDPADVNGDIDVYLRDTVTGETTLLSRRAGGEPLSSGWASSPAVSGDGSSIAFWSNSSQIVAGDTNYTGDLFVYDRASGVTERVSVTSSGAEADGADSGVLSHDGRLAFYRAGAANLVPNDTNGRDDIFVTRRS
jgi:Tol biopolymer transport system component